MGKPFLCLNLQSIVIVVVLNGAEKCHFKGLKTVILENCFIWKGFGHILETSVGFFVRAGVDVL